MTDDITDPDYGPNSIDPDMYERLKQFSSHLGSVAKINFITPKADHIPTGVKSLSEMLNGGIKPHEIALLTVGNTSMGKSDISGYFYRRKVSERAELQAFVDAGVGTTEELADAEQKIKQLTLVINKWERPAVYNHEDLGLIVDTNIGMRGFMDKDGLLEIDSFNFIAPLMDMTEEQIISAARRKPMYMQTLLHATLLPLEKDLPQTGKKEAEWKHGISHGRPIKSEPPKKKHPPSKLLLKLIGKAKDTT